MLSSLTEWARGAGAGPIIFCLRATFFVLVMTTALVVAASGQRVRKSGGGRFLLLSLLFSGALAGILCYQATWQLTGSRNVDFMRFMRRHNKRPSAEVRRGTILDRNGAVLATDDPASPSSGRRRYPLGFGAAHVVGFFDPRYGISGIERAADVRLTGADASAADELRRLSSNITGHRPVEGGDVQLTLDARLQRKAAELMAGRRGGVVVLRPDSGEIYVLFSAPGFDPAAPGGYYGDSAAAPFFNRAIQGRYPAGSTFKIAMASMACNRRMAPIFDTPPGGFSAAPGARPIRDVEYYTWRKSGRQWRGFGKIGLKDALVHSSNVYFAQLGLACPADVFNAYVDAVGINSPMVLYRDPTESGVPPFEASAGDIARIKESDRRTRAQFAIGQGTMAVSPLHVAVWTALVAADGVLFPPRLNLRASESSGDARRIISAVAAKNVAAMLREVIRCGTGRQADISGIGVCGKTGTAQAPGGADHSWFTCFTTTTTPRLVVTVLVERGGYGSKSALPVARALLEEALALEIIKSDGGSGAK